MRESAAYALIKEEGHQEGLQQGLQQGIQQGIQQGMQQGMLQDAREMVLQAVRIRFGVVPVETEAQVNRIASRFTLTSLLEQAIRSESLKEFQEALKRVLEQDS